MIIHGHNNYNELIIETQQIEKANSEIGLFLVRVCRKGKMGIENHTAFHLEAVQTTADDSKDSALVD